MKIINIRTLARNGSLALMAITIICGGCATVPQPTPPQESSGSSQSGATNDIADTLPINPLVQELRKQALEGVQFFPMFQPRPLAQVDVSARIKEWQDKELPDSSAQPMPAANGVFTLEGTSVFILERKEDSFIASWGIPATDGKITTRGAIWQVSTLAVGGGGQVSSTVLSGVVWTPRVSVIGKMDLSANVNVTTAPDFNFDAFKASPGVIPFANGYAVNLFGERLDERGVVDVNNRSKGSYITDDGKPLHGRLVRSRLGKLEEIIFAP